MKLIELWKVKTSPTISFEFFPVRDEKAGKRLNKAMDRAKIVAKVIGQLKNEGLL
jgi:5,10-methylenetetrahydrofolate reductase